ncbi:hypothetical protein IWZ00DRAFT_214270 [Phyllosticta capitalensis]
MKKREKRNVRHKENTRLPRRVAGARACQKRRGALVVPRRGSPDILLYPRNREERPGPPLRPLPHRLHTTPKPRPFTVSTPCHLGRAGHGKHAGSGIVRSRVFVGCHLHHAYFLYAGGGSWAKAASEPPRQDTRRRPCRNSGKMRDSRADWPARHRDCERRVCSGDESSGRAHRRSHTSQGNHGRRQAAGVLTAVPATVQWIACLVMVVGSDH